MNFKLCIITILSISIALTCTGYIKRCGSMWKQDMNTTLFKQNSDFRYANPQTGPDQDPGNTCYIRLSPEERDYALEELKPYKPETLLESNEITHLIQRPMMVEYSTAQLGELAHGFSKLLQDLRDSKAYTSVGHIVNAIKIGQKKESKVAAPGNK